MNFLSLSVVSILELTKGKIFINVRIYSLTKAKYLQTSEFISSLIFLLFGKS